MWNKAGFYISMYTILHSEDITVSFAPQIYRKIEITVVIVVCRLYKIMAKIANNTEIGQNIQQNLQTVIENFWVIFTEEFSMLRVLYISNYL